MTTWGIRVRRHHVAARRFAALRDRGFSHVEWEWAWDGDGESPVPPPPQCREARALAAQHGLTLSVAGPTGLSIAEKMRPLRRVSVRLWREMYAAIAELGARWLVLELGAAGCSPDDRDKKQARAAIARDAMQELAGELGPDDPALLIENQRVLEPGFKRCYLGDDPADLLVALGELAGPQVGIMFDTGHALIRRAPLGVLEALAPRLRALALHANGGERDEHRALGPEDVRAHPRYWAEVAAAARRCPVVIEIDDLDEACRCRSQLVAMMEPQDNLQEDA